MSEKFNTPFYVVQRSGRAFPYDMKEDNTKLHSPIINMDRPLTRIHVIIVNIIPDEITVEHPTITPSVLFRKPFSYR